MVCIPRATVQGAVIACRGHDSRLTGLLNHLTARAIIRSLQKRGQSFTKLVAFTPYDLRHLLEQDANTMANLVSSVNETMEVSIEALKNDDGLTSEDWNKISATTSLLRQRSLDFVDQPVRLLGFLPSYRNYLHGLANTLLNESFCLSNLGSLDGGADTDDPTAWRICNAIFSQSSYAAGAALLFNVASTKNGDLNMTVTWWPGVLGIGGGDDEEHAFVREICTDIALHLDAVVR
jgi:hypothetical protein